MGPVDLYLVRHAIAEPRDSERWPDDASRPLTENGVKLFRAAARGLRSLGIGVETVLASSYARAWETAEILQAEAQWPSPTECRALEPGAPALHALTAVDGRGKASLALVGHEPQLSMIASLVLTGSPDTASLELKKGGVVYLHADDALTPGVGTLRWSASPKMLRSLGRGASTSD
jgi:phosphohistidine phosphatase